MDKTPIMILQEKMAKQQCIPQYDIILAKTGTHQNTFTYRVVCKGLTADGTGPNKKEAKQNAASAMLNLLKLETADSNTSKSSLSLQSPKVSNSESLQCKTLDKILTSPAKPQEDFVNYVGKLQELCVQHRYPDPVYTELDVLGVQHRPEFRMKCVVSTIEEEASAPTKKQVKHLAAQKVYRRLLKQREKDDALLSVPDVSLLLGELQIRPTYNVSSTEKAIAKFKQLNKIFVPVKKGFVTDCHLQLKSCYYNKVNVKQLQNFKQSTLGVLDKPVGIEHTVKSLENLFSFSVEQVTLTTNCNRFMFALRINYSPVIIAIGVGSSLYLAQLMAMENLIETLILMMA